MLKQILVPWDGSESADEAVKTAFYLAGRSGGTVTVLYVIISSHEWRGPLDDPRVACSIARVEDFDRCVQDTGSLKEKLRRLVGNDADFDVQVRVGSPISHIVGLAREQNATLIVMGTRGMGVWKGLLLGSVSSRVAHSAPCPVMLTGGKRRFDRILVAMDDSEASERAVACAGALAKTTGAAVTLVSVDRIVPTIVPSPGAYELVNLHTGILAREALKAGRRIANEMGVSVDEVEEAGDPTARILAVAEDGEYDLVVVGHHGKGALENLLTGGTGDRVMHMAGRPVLVAR